MPARWRGSSDRVGGRPARRRVGPVCDRFGWFGRAGDSVVDGRQARRFGSNIVVVSRGRGMRAKAPHHGLACRRGGAGLQTASVGRSPSPAIREQHRGGVAGVEGCGLKHRTTGGRAGEVARVFRPRRWAVGASASRTGLRPVRLVWPGWRFCGGRSPSPAIREQHRGGVAGVEGCGLKHRTTGWYADEVARVFRPRRWAGRRRGRRGG